jgi:fructose-1,6-bisphosphatase/inositol monophosphatase family enzyme
MTVSEGATLSDSVLAAMGEVSERIIMPRYKSLSEGDVRSKTHPGDLVTIADEEAERELSRVFRELLPGSLVVGEESVSENPELLNQLETDNSVWIIDPIDGTSNFVHGRDQFGVVVALVRGGETVMGWILNPISRDALRAERGEGTWLRNAEGDHRQTIRETEEGPLAGMTAGLYHPEFSLLKGKFARVMRLGCAAHDYWSLASGNMQVLCYRRLKPWDHAAGALIHKEAGGYNQLLSGEAYNPCTRDQVGLLCAPSAEIWADVAKLKP